MGTWLGHAAPGTFFLGFGIWWTIRTFQLYFTKQGRYVNTSFRPCCCRGRCLGSLNYEGIVLIILAIMGVAAEVITGKIDPVFPVGNTQHCTMYVAFGMYGLVSILVHHKVKFLPKGADYLMLMLALLIELVLFAFHLHGREVMDKHVHMLLVYAIMACIASVAAEIVYPRSVTAAIARNYCVLLQGSWFVQLGFTLYNPIPGAILLNPSLPENIMITTLIFAWHLIGCLMVTLILGGLTFWCCSPRCQGDYEEMASRQLLPSNGKMKHSRSVHSDDEEEELFTASPHHDDSV